MRARRAESDGGVRLRFLSEQADGATRLTRMRLIGVPAGSRVEVRCSGEGCPFARRSLAGRRTVYLARLFAGSALRPGATVELRVRAAGRTVRAYRLTAQAGAAPRRQVL